MDTADQLLTIDQVAKILGIHKTTAIRHFENYPGVINLGPSNREQRQRGQRRYRLLRIPRSVFNRFLYEKKVHAER